jgi:hypothetical protein
MRNGRGPRSAGEKQGQDVAEDGETDARDGGAALHKDGIMHVRDAPKSQKETFAPFFQKPNGGLGGSSPTLQ